MGVPEDFGGNASDEQALDDAWPVRSDRDHLRFRFLGDLDQLLRYNTRCRPRFDGHPARRVWLQLLAEAGKESNGATGGFHPPFVEQGLIAF